MNTGNQATAKAARQKIGSNCNDIAKYCLHQLGTPTSL